MDEVLEQVKKWLGEGAQLRASLVSERKVVAERLREIDAALAALPDGDASVTRGQAEFDLPKNAFAPTIVRAILRRNPTGLDAAAIVAASRAVRAGLSPLIIHSALHRLAKKGVIEAHGKRGARRYRLSETPVIDTTGSK